MGWGSLIGYYGGDQGSLVGRKLCVLNLIGGTSGKIFDWPRRVVREGTVNGGRIVFVGLRMLYSDWIGRWGKECNWVSVFALGEYV